MPLASAIEADAMPDYPIIDSHIHLYDPAWLRYSWMATRPALNRLATMAEFDAARGPVAVAATVFVEVHVDAGLHFAEADWVQLQADGEPRIAAMVAAAPVEKGAAIEADLDRLQRYPALRGVRRLLEVEADASICLEPGFVDGVRRVGARGLSFDLCVRHWQLVHAIPLVRRCPDVTFILDHLGKPGIRHGLFEPWAGQLALLAQEPNVVCKLSGVITEAARGSWTAADLDPYLQHALACFGPARLLYGSDWTVSSETHAYPEWVAVVDRLLAGCTAIERDAVWRQNAIDVYRLALPGMGTTGSSPAPSRSR